MTHYNLDALIIGAILGIISAVCAITVSKRFIFKRFRLWAKGTDKEWFAELCGCHWCLVFWFSLVLNKVFYTAVITSGYSAWLASVLEFGVTQFWIFSIGTITLRLIFDSGTTVIHQQEAA